MSKKSLAALLCRRLIMCSTVLDLQKGNARLLYFYSHASLYIIEKQIVNKMSFKWLFKSVHVGFYEEVSYIRFGIDSSLHRFYILTTNVVALKKICFLKILHFIAFCFFYYFIFLWLDMFTCFQVHISQAQLLWMWNIVEHDTTFLRKIFLVFFLFSWCFTFG